MPSASSSLPASADPAPPPAGDLAVYIHWPFCRSKCPYCDFNSHVREGIDEERWLCAYRVQLRHFAAETDGRTIRSIFFGGGTPSLMRPATAAAVLDEIAGLWPVAADVEVTREANPTTAEAGRSRDFAAAGIGRLSLGVQALDDAALRSLGRGHSAAEAVAAVALAARTFSRFSFDLIWGRPGQQPADWGDELRRATTMAGDHLSVYQLTIEPGTAFRRDGVAAADEDDALAMWLLTQEVLAATGLPAYEISNHARAGGDAGTTSRSGGAAATSASAPARTGGSPPAAA
ncbi:MAG: radical SAM protein [Rhodospirillales bacterium]